MSAEREVTIMKNRTLIAAASIAAVAALAAPPAMAGLRTGSFALNSHGVRAMGMGGAFVGLADDSSATFWNPAGLVFAGRGQFSASYATLYGIPGLSAQNVTYGTGDPARGGYGAAFSRLGGKIGMGESAPTQLFSETDIQISAARSVYDRGVRIVAGVSGHLLTVGSDLPGMKGRGYAADAGVLAGITKEITVGARIRSLYSSFDWDTNLEDTVPFEWSAGFGWKLAKNAVIAAAFEGGQDTGPRTVRAGAEYVLGDERGSLYKQVKDIALRAGGLLRMGTGGGSAIAAGTTIQVEASAGLPFGLDYAILFDTQGLGTSHRFGLTARR